MMPTLGEKLGLVLLGAAVFAGLSCQSSPSAGPPVELDRALARVVPPSAPRAPPPTYDAGTNGVSGSREFEADVDCASYCEWVKMQFAAAVWQVHDGGADEVFLTKYTTGDRYVLSVRCLRNTRPIRVRAVVQGAPD